MKQSTMAVIATLLLAGCGAMPAESRAPRSPSQAPTSAGMKAEEKSAEEPTKFRSVEEAQDALNRAARDFDGAVAKKAGAVDAPKASDKPPSTQPVSPTAPTAPNAGGYTPKAEPAQQAEATSPCAVGCKALSSMQRASDSICRMTSESDERCVSARKRVSDSAAKLNGCGCGS
ncbi:MAG: hypothetical protein U0165_04710 [Polyangiaceae bacterium]